MIKLLFIKLFMHSLFKIVIKYKVSTIDCVLKH